MPTFRVALALLFTVPVFAATNSWPLASPDGLSVINVSLAGDGALSYEVTRRGKPVLAPSPLGLRRDDQDYERGVTFNFASAVTTRHEIYDLLAGTAPHVDHVLNGRVLLFHSTNGVPLEIDLAASDEGVAFRYVFPDTSTNVHVVNSEATGFAVPTGTHGWLQPYHAAGPFTPACEDFFFHVAPGDSPPDSRAKAVGWSLPALFDVPGGTWALLSESGTDEEYCACHLGPDSSGGLYRVEFPLADQTTRGWTNRFGPQPRFSLPWRMPWRVLILGDTAGAIALSTLITDLAPPSQIPDASWVKPGRASWGWWAHPEGPATVKMFNEFTDFAAGMGWEYTLFDAGWWQPGIQEIASYAASKGVIPLAWNFATEFYDPQKRREKLDFLSKAGVRGVKVDFWCSDRQEAMAAMHGLFADAAARHMIVNLHGCTIPRGWQRTWPNFLTCEAVLGLESYFYEPRYTEKAAELNTVLPFTRNAVGPMDITPVGCSPKKYSRMTTAAHELAAALIYTSGIVHYADQPSFFRSLPLAVLQVFRDAPARWDQTRCLEGVPGRDVIFARHAGQSWFIAGINGTGAPIAVNLDLSAFAAFQRRTAISEGTNPNMEVATAPLEVETHWSHSIPPRGGFILRLDK